MAVINIALVEQNWKFRESDHIDDGGFASVFSGVDECGPVAIKRLKDAPRGFDERELKIAARFTGQTLAHIVPVLDYGIDANSGSAFVVMPLCDETLQAYSDRKGPLSVVEALDILNQCVRGLIGADGIVHRDLKPSNIMLHEENWKIADFGIAKAVQDNTSLETLRDALTPAYASPEQWNQERPTHKSDIYSLGCLLHFLITGSPPFVGSIADLKDGHLHQDFSAIEDAPPALVTLVNLLTRKSPGSRPSLKRIGGLIEKAKVQSESRNASELSGLSSEIGAARAKQETHHLRLEKEATTRREIAAQGVEEFNDMRHDLLTLIKEEAPEAALDKGSVILGQGTLHFCEAQKVDVSVNGYTIVAESLYKVIWAASALPDNHSVVLRNAREYKFSASLFYGKAEGEEDFRWYEVAFCGPFSGSNAYSPFQVSVGDQQFKVAFDNVIGTLQASMGPRPVDVEDYDAFCDRLVNLFTRAAKGSLRAPNRHPVPDCYFDVPLDL